MNAKRKIGIGIALVLGTFALLYLGGLLGQAMDHYDAWMLQGGLSGGASLRYPDLHPFSCIAYAPTHFSGLKAMLLLLAAGAGITLYLSFSRRFSSQYDDGRNFTASKLGTYGTSGWMTDAELKSVLRLDPPGRASGVILGARKDKLVCLPTDTRLNPHILVIGASGTRKSRGFVRPYALECVRRGESIVLTDPKGELYADMAAYFRDNGYAVRVFNLVDPTHSDSWNPMGDLRGDPLLAQILSSVVILNTAGEHSDRFWNDNEQNLLDALVLYIDLDASRTPEEKSLGAVYRLIAENDERRLHALFDALPLDHPARAPYSFFRQASDSVRAGALVGLGTRLQILQIEAVRKLTSFHDIDLTQPAREKIALFILSNDQESSLDFLSSLFFSFLFIRLVRFADQSPAGRCPVPVNLCLDEFNNIGTIPDIARRLSTIRSREIRVAMIIQNLAQLQNRYPHNLWAELAGNCDTQLMLGCTDTVTAEYISARAGDMTVEVGSTSMTRQTLALAQMVPQYRQTQSVGRRSLLTVDEALRLPNDEALVILRGQKILKVDKYDYSRHPDAKRLTPSSIQDYAPSHHSSAKPMEEAPRPPAPAEAPDGPYAPPRKGKLFSQTRPPDF